MKQIFSPASLRVIGIIALSLLSIYVLFLIFPYLEPLKKLINAVLFPLVISMIIAYLLHPLVDLLMKIGLSRLLSILSIYIFFFGGLTFLIWYAAPIFVRQLQDLLEEWPHIQQMISTWGTQFNQHLERLPNGIHRGIEDALFRIQADSQKSIVKIVEGSSTFLNTLFALFVIPFLVFYFLQDAKIMNRTIFHLIPSVKRKKTLELWKDIDHSLGEYIRGQIIVSLVVGFLSLAGYLLIGLPYSLFLSAIMAIMNIIPYFGPLIGAAPAIIVAILTKPVLVIWVVVINIGIQVVEGNVLAPWIVGKRLHIHPVFIILALLVGHEAGGIFGLILAVPILVVLKVVITHATKHVRIANKQTVSKD